MLTFSVITPSFQQVDWLKLAIRSVQDQGFPVEHIVQDAVSADGTAEMLASHSAVRAYVEKDSGMYDAINRGLRRSTGDIVSYLNCDEQYLPGALAKVSDFFEKNPEIDLLFAGLVIVNSDGEYICSRKVLPPLAAHTRVCHLSTFTCSTFFRRRVFERNGLFFDTQWKAVGDAEWILRCLEQGLKMRAIPDFTSVFVDSGDNLGTTAAGEAERTRLSETAPDWQRAAVPLIAAHHRVRRWLGGIYRQRQFDYAIYTRSQPAQRKLFLVPNPTTLWKERFTLLR